LKAHKNNIVLEEIFEVSQSIRYVALYRGGSLESLQRDDLRRASQSESDTYEELLVNPAIMTLVRQRGDIDCGGAQFVVIRYGNFYQLVIDLTDGHVSVCVELASNPLELVEEVQTICRERFKPEAG
jgi:hypothetical protein